MYFSYILPSSLPFPHPFSVFRDSINSEFCQGDLQIILFVQLILKAFFQFYFAQLSLCLTNYAIK